MSSPLSSREAMDREFLPTRAKILEIAAALDRVARAEEGIPADPRWSQLRAALQLLIEEHDDRAEQVQLLFSRPYDADWHDALGVSKSK
jgi:hypothetical protein